MEDEFVNSAKISSLRLSWNQQVQRVHKDAQVIYFVFKLPRVRWYARLLAACTAGYLFSPIQLIPNFIPIFGFMDDILVLFFGIKLLYKIIPPDVLTECRERVETSEMQRKDEIRTVPARIVFIVVAVLWLLVGGLASVQIMRYFLSL